MERIAIMLIKKIVSDTIRYLIQNSKSYPDIEYVHKKGFKRFRCNAITDIVPTCGSKQFYFLAGETYYA